jgi:hypothetical protein
MQFAQKRKGKPAPPDVQLARAFGFDGEDLAVNRGGYMTRRQHGTLEFALAYLTDRVVKRIYPNAPSHGFRQVRSLCGRAHLNRISVNDPRFRQTRAISYALFRFEFMLDGTNTVFILSEAQFAALTEGAVYRVYMDADQPGRVLSLERLTATCEDSDS